jgi:hypothetical protein
MMDRTKNVLIVVLVAALAFVLGRAGSAPGGQDRTLTAEPLASDPLLTPGGSPVLPPQGRRSGRGGSKGTGTGAEPLVFDSSTGGPGSANGFIAVTGSYGIGTSVLYVLDTRSRQLAVYEARGGSRNSRRVQLVGARRLDLDLQLEGYNDESEFSYADLLQRFLKKGMKGGRETPTPSKEAPRKLPSSGKEK